jgi:GxxExxY protein
MDYQPISQQEEQIASAIVDAAYTVHTKLGPGLLENVYEVCFCYELTKRGLDNRRQVVVPIVYDEITFDEGLRLDMFATLSSLPRKPPGRRVSYL